VALYESLLPLIEERLASFYEKIEAVSAVSNQWQETAAQQQQAIVIAQQVVETISPPEPVLA